MPRAANGGLAVRRAGFRLRKLRADHRLDFPPDAEGIEVAGVMRADGALDGGIQRAVQAVLLNKIFGDFSGIVVHRKVCALSSCPRGISRRCAWK